MFNDKEEDNKLPGVRTDLPTKANGKTWNRATTYEPAYCQTLLECMAIGQSYAQVAAKIGVAKSTLLDWTRQFPDFGDAYKLGKDLAEAWWDQAAQLHLVTVREKGMPESVFSVPIWLHNVKVRFGQREVIDPTVIVEIKKDEDIESARKLAREIIYGVVPQITNIGLEDHELKNDAIHLTCRPEITD